jgi:hypothetical protein
MHGLNEPNELAFIGG